MKEHTLLVIGGGSAGLTAAEAAATLNMDVALVEGKRVGGDCTWTGCVPSKALLNAAKIAHHARHSAHMGITSAGVEVDFPHLMQHIRETIHSIYDEESPDALRARSVTVYEAYAQFREPHIVELSTGETLRAKKIILATGAQAIVPAAFQDAPYMTHETLFDLQALPQHLLIVGGGPIGVEMAQAFVRLGSRVTLVTDRARILHRDEPQASAVIHEVLQGEGVTIHTGQKAVSAAGSEGAVQVTLEDGTTLDGSHLLLAMGKRVDVRSLNPDAAGIAHDEGRLIVSDTLRTSQKHIFAAGDVAGGPMFTHAASSEATVALINAISPVPTKRKPTMPWATFTDPEVAQAGYTEAQLQAQGQRYDVTQLPITRADRAMTDDQRAGFMRLLHTRYGKLLGATIVGPNAGEMMNEWAAIIERGGRVSQAATPTHIYPTLGVSNAILATEQLRKLAHDTALGRFLKGLLRRLV